MALGGFAVRPTATPPASAALVGTRSIVAVQVGISPSIVAARYGVTPIQVYTAVLNGFSAQLSAAQVAALQLDPQVDGVTADQVVTLPLADGSNGRATNTSTVPTGVDRIDAENAVVGDLNRHPTNIAILDTGAGPHKDLKVTKRVNCLLPGCPAGGDDDNGHGTHVAGIAAGKANGGARGVAPGAPIWSVKVLDNNAQGTFSDLIAGIDVVTNWKQTLGGQWVANLSLAAAGTENGTCKQGVRKPLTDPLHQAVCDATQAGVVMVAAAGNGSVDSALVVPAAYNEVITVSGIADYDGKGGHLGSPPTCVKRPDGTFNCDPGAVGTDPVLCNRGADDTLSATSNFGKDVDLAAPGACIKSLWLGNGYNVMSGTSTAAPHVTGAIALKMSTGELTVNAAGDSMTTRSTALGVLETVPQDDKAPWAPCSFSDPTKQSKEPLVYVGQPRANCQ
jgi:subtilisin family serine protease